MVHNREAFVSCMHSVIFIEKKCYQRSVSIAKLISCAGIILDIIAWALCGCVILVRIWNIPVWRKLVLLQKREEETLSIITESASKKEKQYLIIHTGRCCETSMRCVLCNHCWWPCCQAFQKHVLWSPDFVCMSWLGELGFKLGWLGLLRSGRGCKFSWVVVACAETFPHNHNWVPPFCNFRYVLKQKVVWVVYSDFFCFGLDAVAVACLSTSSFIKKEIS